jgi:hypothetical protein
LRFELQHCLDEVSGPGWRVQVSVCRVHSDGRS